MNRARTQSRRDGTRTRTRNERLLDIENMDMCGVTDGIPWIGKNFLVRIVSMLNKVTWPSA